MKSAIVKNTAYELLSMT